MNAIKQFYIRNQQQITWFLNGWLTLAGIEDLGRGNYVGALISFGLIYLNYKLS